MSTEPSPRPFFEDEAKEPADSWCEWPTRSHYREATCGRTGHSASRWGMRLCWQHQDAMFSEVAERIRSKRVPDVILEALLIAVRANGKDDLLRPPHAGWSDVIDEEMARRVRSGSTRFGANQFDEAVNELMSTRLTERWSA